MPLRSPSLNILPYCLHNTCSPDFLLHPAFPFSIFFAGSSSLKKKDTFLGAPPWALTYTFSRDVARTHVLKYHPNANNSQIYISSPELPSELHFSLVDLTTYVTPHLDISVTSNIMRLQTHSALLIGLAFPPVLSICEVFSIYLS